MDVYDEKMYEMDESHNLRGALKYFSNVTKIIIPDNSKRAAEITEIIPAFW